MKKYLSIGLVSGVALGFGYCFFIGAFEPKWIIQHVVSFSVLSCMYTRCMYKDKYRILT